MDELNAKLDRAAYLISGLMDMLKYHPDYHGAGIIDEAYEYLRDDEIEKQQPNNN